MKTLNILGLIGDDYKELDDIRLEEILKGTFERLSEPWGRMTPNGAYTMHERTTVYERQGLTATRRTEWHNDWDQVKVYTRDEIILTGKEKETETYAGLMNYMITGAYE